MAKRFMLIVLTVILSACGGPDNTDTKVSPTPAIDPSIAALSDTIGDPDTVKHSNKLSIEHARSAAQDYEPATGKWFKENDGLNLITSYSSGDIRAGSKGVAELSRIPVGRSIRFQLTSRDTEGNRIALIEEYAADIDNTLSGHPRFSYRVPEQPNANYLLSIEVLSSEGAIEDTFLSPLFVPPNEINARLTVNSLAAGSEQTTLILYNAGPAELFFGYGYQIYRQESEGWRPIPLEIAVPAIGIIIKPGESFEETVSFSDQLKPGQYRLIKQFAGNMTDAEVRLAADFEVQ